MSEAQTIEPGAIVGIDGRGGVAWRIRRFASTQVPIESYGWDDEEQCEYTFDSDELEEIEDRDRVIAVMVGDDHEFTFDIEEARLLAETDYCHQCGSIGCTHDGLERE